jgi:Zn-dependent peptidase ImmA (M78 family)
MTTRRDAILSGVARAAELHAQLGLRDALLDGNRPIDVISSIQRLGLFVMFRPLDGLLGAYVPTRALSGMLITTKRDMHVQRFTAAHELGHHVLEHKTLSLDKEVGFVGRGESSGHELQEVEADSFAAEFLLPKWLIAAHLRRQKWGRADLGQSDVVYQLSLRLGASYTATCWALLSQGFLNRRMVEQLVAAQPRAVKRRAVPGLTPDHWHRDVWVLSERDRGTHVLGSPDDYLVIALEEHIAGGYSWDTDGVIRAGLKLEKDERADHEASAIGASVQRRLVVQGAGTGHLTLEERRAWDQSQPSINTFDLDLALVGREPEGIPRAGRLLAA